ncbi:hypothetical protein [Streptomyces sp. LN325]|uniref:hypothetical protein n=1 Tax=Streptomyces sp. LN325 TaxID=3112976 RepID=UPI0037110891
MLPALYAAQITSWGILYHAITVLSPRITAATGWPHRGQPITAVVGQRAGGGRTS